MTDLKLWFWDLEMSPLKGAFWSLWPNSIPIGMLEETQRILCWGGRWYDKKTVEVSDEREGQLEMLTKLRDRLTEADAVVSWNGQGFDTRQANRAFVMAGLTPPSPYKEIDLMKVAKSRFKFASNKLDHVAQELGVGRKIDTGGYQLWVDVMAGDEAAWRKMLKYQKQDVNLLVDIFERFKPWIKFPHPVSNTHISCRNCGGTHLQSRGTAKTIQGEYNRYQCQDCGAWSRDNDRRAVGSLKNIT